jgi:hypothetical protein
MTLYIAHLRLVMSADPPSLQLTMVDLVDQYRYYLPPLTSVDPLSLQ